MYLKCLNVHLKLNLRMGISCYFDTTVAIEIIVKIE